MFVALGRIRVQGSAYIRSVSPKNLLLLANHPSLLEPALLPFFASMPAALRNKASVLWQTPKETAFKDVKNPIVQKLVESLPYIYLKVDENDFSSDPIGLRRIMRAQKMHNPAFLIFFEGMRTFFSSEEGRRFTATGVPIGKPRTGIGFMIAHMRPTVVPVLVKNTDRVLPVGAPWYTALKNIWIYRIEIIFGSPIRFSHRFGQQKSFSKTEMEALAEEVRSAVLALDEPLAS